jgi:hypothetical protein
MGKVVKAVITNVTMLLTTRFVYISRLDRVTYPHAASLEYGFGCEAIDADPIVVDCEGVKAWMIQ